jgi:hypothetical protein
MHLPFLAATLERSTHFLYPAAPDNSKVAILSDNVKDHARAAAEPEEEPTATN